MESRTSVEKPAPDVELAKNISKEHVLHFYAPRMPEEKVLDRSINTKLDFIILPLLALNFMVGDCIRTAYLKRSLVKAIFSYAGLTRRILEML